MKGDPSKLWRFLTNSNKQYLENNVVFQEVVLLGGINRMYFDREHVVFER